MSMNSHIAGVIAISLSFSCLAAERQGDLLHTAPTATRSTMLICKAERISDGVATTLAGRAYLEGVGEQILLALIPTTQSAALASTSSISHNTYMPLAISHRHWSLNPWKWFVAEDLHAVPFEVIQLFPFVREDDDGVGRLRMFASQ